MRNSTILGLLAALALVTLAAKSLAGRANVTPPAPRVEAALQAALHGQGFVTTEVKEQGLSTLLVGRRGLCKVAVRDGADAGWQSSIFEQAAGAVGPVRYVYRGRVYTQPPNLQMLADHILQRVGTDVGLRPAIHINIALASGPECGTGGFQPRDVQVDQS